MRTSGVNVRFTDITGIAGDTKSKLEELDKLLLEKGIYDESSVNSESASDTIIYYKEGSEVFSITFEQTGYSIIVSGHKWNFSPLFQLPVEKELVNEQTLSWRMKNLSTVDDTKLMHAMKASLMDSNEFEELLKNVLIIIKSYKIKSNFFHQAEKEIMELVMGHFWNGKMEPLYSLYQRYSEFEKDKFSVFINKWEETLDNKIQINSNHLSPEMDVDPTKLNRLIYSLQDYLEKYCQQYIHSIKDIWFQYELLENKAMFNDRVDEIRKTIVTIREFIKDMDHLISEKITNQVDEASATNEKEGSPSKLKENVLLDSFDGLQIQNAGPTIPFHSLLVKPSEPNKRLPFIEKEFIQEENNGFFVLNEIKLDKLVGSVLPEKKYQEEMKMFIQMIFEMCNNKGYALKDNVNKKLIEKTNFEPRFEGLMDILLTYRIVKEEAIDVQTQEQSKILFNFNVEIYDII